MTIVSVNNWTSNGALIRDVEKLGLIPEGLIFDATFGLGTFWAQSERVLDVVGNDLRRTEVPYNLDFTQPFPTRMWGNYSAVVFDPPYKLNGTPTDDDRYGADEKVSVSERKRRIMAGLYHTRFLIKPGGVQIVKTQNQIANGQYHDLVGDITLASRGMGMHVDAMFHMTVAPRPQRSQKRARNNYSTLLVLRERSP